ncbi:MAG: hypothetical protein FWD32_01975 [Firmicutes bacterium]|nr:hypothetical protein [Bacillota bacterium]
MASTKEKGFHWYGIFIDSPLGVHKFMSRHQLDAKMQIEQIVEDNNLKDRITEVKIIVADRYRVYLRSYLDTEQFSKTLYPLLKNVRLFSPYQPLTKQREI